SSDLSRKLLLLLGALFAAMLVSALVGGVRAVGPVRAVGWGDRPELSQACRLSMGIAMLAMLVTL
ncbi:hypothetical protein ACWCQ4_32250, partial [Streptomyces aureus]